MVMHQKKADGGSSDDEERIGPAYQVEKIPEIPWLEKVEYHEAFKMTTQERSQGFINYLSQSEQRRKELK